MSHKISVFDDQITKLFFYMHNIVCVWILGDIVIITMRKKFDFVKVAFW